MNKLLKTFIAPTVIALAFVATPALADCTQDIENVKTVAQSAALSDEDKAKVEAATMAATEKQAAGDEDGCVAEITSAKMILKVE
jgi:hypothetical protein